VLSIFFFMWVRWTLPRFRYDQVMNIGWKKLLPLSIANLIAYTIDDDRPTRELRLGFDTTGRLLETVVLLLDDGAELVIHAMKARPQYFDLLP